LARDVTGPTLEDNQFDRPIVSTGCRRSIPVWSTGGPWAGHDWAMIVSGPAALVLTPGASAGKDQSGLVAVDQSATLLGIVVERVEFPGQAAGKRRPDPPEVCIRTIVDATAALADRLAVPTRRVAVGGRSMGGRMCSMAAAEGLEVAALVLISYPLHPPGRPERLRTAHFPEPPCLACSSPAGGTHSPPPPSWNVRSKLSPGRSRSYSWTGTTRSGGGMQRWPTSSHPG
jgi:pimeloyl-ACP methyl ester carboxylesterase